MTSLPLADHPVRWRQAVQPADIDQDRLLLAPHGAAAAGLRVDALIDLDHHESQRRTLTGLDAVTSLTVLDVLGSLPLGYPIAIADLNAREERILRSAPDGCVTFSSTAVTRTVRPPVTVAAALIRSKEWKTALRQSVTYAPLTQRIIVRRETPTTSQALEAQVVGAGIWIDHGHRLEEHLPAEPYIPKYFKAAGWRFAENAYRTYNSAGYCRPRADAAQHACC